MPVEAASVVIVGSVLMPIMELRGGALADGLAWLRAALGDLVRCIRSGGWLYDVETLAAPWTRGGPTDPVRRLTLPELADEVARAGLDTVVRLPLPRPDDREGAPAVTGWIEILGMDPAEQQVNDTRTAGVIARPPLLILTALLIGLALDRLLVCPFAVPGTDLVHWITAASMILLGISLFAAGIRSFVRAATPVPTNQSTRVLVTTGIHSWTRNPIYLGMFLVYGGIGIAARSPWTLILTLPLVVTIRYGVVAREEAYLERRFGDAYRDYMGRVPRWL